MNFNFNWEELEVTFSNSYNDIYFSKDYYRLYTESDEGEASFFVFQKDDKTVFYPFLINSINQLGYKLDKDYYDIQGAYGYNGFLTNSNDSIFLKEFFSSFNGYCKEKNIVAEFTRFHPLLQNHVHCKDYLQIIFDRETIALNLNQSIETIWTKEYSSTNRNMIRKAQRNGLTIQILSAPGKAEIDLFTEIYWHSMKMADANDYYYFSKEFFYNTFSFLSDNTFLFNVLDKNDQVICSAIFFYFGDYFHYHLSGRTSNADNSVNNFLLDEAVKFAKTNGAKMFHFGGGRSPSKEDSLLNFKSNFSKTRLPFFIGKKIHNQEIYSEIVDQWEQRFPDKVEKYRSHLLKYRF